MQINSSVCQTTDFSQIHTNYIYTNPAFAGIKSCPQLYTSYRNKFNSIDGGYSSNFLSFDMYSSTIKSDLAIRILHDIQSNTFYSTSIMGIYAKEFQVKKKLFFKFGLGIGALRNGFQTKNLIFSDMIDPFESNISPSQEEILSKNVTYLDIEPGILLYNDIFFSGISIKHLEEGITKKTKEFNRINRTVSIHSGCELSTTKAFTQKHLIWFYPHINITISPSASYTQVGVVSQKGKVQFGVGYRENFPLEAESFLVFVGFFEKKYKFAYNCDVTINSHIKNNYNSHEISFSYAFECPTKKKKYEAVKAPIF